MRLIDADKFIEWLDVGHLRSPSEVCYSEGDVKVMIDRQPTIEAVPVVHGEWENVGDDEELCFRCTNCKAEFSCEIDMRQFAKHCPECGADMQKGGANQ